MPGVGMESFKYGILHIMYKYFRLDSCIIFQLFLVIVNNDHFSYDSNDSTFSGLHYDNLEDYV